MFKAGRRQRSPLYDELSIPFIDASLPPTPKVGRSSNPLEILLGRIDGSRTSLNGETNIHSFPTSYHSSVHFQIHPSLGIREFFWEEMLIMTWDGLRISSGVMCREEARVQTSYTQSGQLSWAGNLIFSIRLSQKRAHGDHKTVSHVSLSNLQCYL